MARHRTYSIEFKRQVAQEFLGEYATLLPPLPALVAEALVGAGAGRIRNSGPYIRLAGSPGDLVGSVRRLAADYKWSIPAWAGESRSGTARRPRPRVYPRVGGGTP